MDSTDSTPAHADNPYHHNLCAVIGVSKMMIEDPIAEFIEAAADGLCTAYVVVATVERIDGSQSFWITTLNRQTSSTTLGLLVSATSAEQYRIAKSLTQGM
jgi:hypothetical protein